ncbi:MAG: hypothetical protein JST32_05225 [Bacteroidetes bacterium]|nr:hypothetical protein [Bacteroidota bacterium]
MDKATLKLRIRICLWIVIIGLALSGITAFPLESELAVLNRHTSPDGILGAWLHEIYYAVKTTNNDYPWLSYGTDWLAFAHLVIAVVFIGPLRDPVRNIWVIRFGMIACIGIFPLAFIAGPIRNIPFFWQMIDCSFGLLGFIPLYISYRYTCRLEKE